MLVGASGQREVFERARIDRENADGRAVFWRHVGDRRAVGQGETADAGAVVLDELADDAFLSQHLDDGEHRVGRRRAGGKLPRHLEADDLGDEHRDRLAEHHGLGFDAADAPAQNPQAVDHRRVRIRADEGVGIGEDFSVFLGGPDDPREMLEVDLVDDACFGRNDGEILERLLAPIEEDVAFLVSVELDLGVLGEGVGRAVMVDLYRVVDDQVHRNERIDRFWVPADFFDRVAHRCEVDHGGNAGKVLHQYAGGHKRGLSGTAPGFRPVGGFHDVLMGNVAAVLIAQQVFKKEANREREPGDVMLAGQFGESEDVVALAAGLKRAASAEAV